MGSREYRSKDETHTEAEPNKPKRVGITNGIRASVRRMTRGRGQMYTFVMMAKPRKLIKMLSPNNASLPVDRLLLYAG